MSDLLSAIAILVLPSTALVFWSIVCFVFQKNISLTLVLFGNVLLTFGSIFALTSLFGYLEAINHVGEAYSLFKGLALGANYVLLPIVNLVFCVGFLTVKITKR